MGDGRIKNCGNCCRRKTDLIERAIRFLPLGRLRLQNPYPKRKGCALKIDQKIFSIRNRKEIGMVLDASKAIASCAAARL